MAQGYNKEEIIGDPDKHLDSSEERQKSNRIAYSIGSFRRRDLNQCVRTKTLRFD